MSILFYSTNGTVTVIEEKPVEAFSKIANYNNNNNQCYTDISNILLPNKVDGINGEMACVNKASQQYNTIGYQSNENLCWGANYAKNDATYKNFVNNNANIKDCKDNTMHIYQYEEMTNKNNTTEEELKQMENEYNRKLNEYLSLKNLDSQNQQPTQPTLPQPTQPQPTQPQPLQPLPQLPQLPLVQLPQLPLPQLDYNQHNKRNLKKIECVLL
jgi:hypothetical protein